MGLRRDLGLARDDQILELVSARVLLAALELGDDVLDFLDGLDVLDVFTLAGVEEGALVQRPRVPRIDDVQGSGWATTTAAPRLRSAARIWSVLRSTAVWATESARPDPRP
ncbi:MAG: hypothetical protein R3F60_22905 [bacterium]